MGQYWLPVNLDKKEFIDPHKLGVGLKLWEQVVNYPGTAAALVILVAAMPETRGGGDLDLEGEGDYYDVARRIIGRWAGDRIALVGDYAEDSDLAPEFRASQIYDQCRKGEYRDISYDVCTVIEHELGGTFLGDRGWRRFSRGR